MRRGVRVVKTRSAEVRHPTYPSMQPSCPSPRRSRNEKTRSRRRQPGPLVCRKEGLRDPAASEMPPNQRGSMRLALRRPATLRSNSTPARRDPDTGKLTPARRHPLTGADMDGLVEIAPVPAVPRHDLLTYRVPEGLRAQVRPGVRVRMPLGRQTRTGVVAGVAASPPPGELRSILEVLDPEPFLPPALLELARWTARYYLTSLADVIAALVPAGVPAPARERVFRLLRRLTAVEEAELARRPPARPRADRPQGARA